MNTRDNPAPLCLHSRRFKHFIFLGVLTSPWSYVARSFEELMVHYAFEFVLKHSSQLRSVVLSCEIKGDIIEETQ
jgi:hypothetical protein